MRDDTLPIVEDDGVVGEQGAEAGAAQEKKELCAAPIAGAARSALVCCDGAASGAKREEERGEASIVRFRRSSECLAGGTKGMCVWAAES